MKIIFSKKLFSRKYFTMKNILRRNERSFKHFIYKTLTLKSIHAIKRHDM
jgi:hypothetical protein